MISDDTDVLLWGRDSIEILSWLFPSSVCIRQLDRESLPFSISEGRSLK